MARETKTHGPSRHWQTAKEGVWTKLVPEMRRMREKPTHAEAALWERLRQRSLGVRFRRQHVIAHYIVDFCCLPAKLVVEVDGPVHLGQQEHDSARDEFLSAVGFQVLRFRNDEVEQQIDAVLAIIQHSLRQALRENPDV